MPQRGWLKLMKNYDLTMHYHLRKANVVTDALNRKSEGSSAVFITQQSSLLKEIEKMQVKEPMMIVSKINQVM